MADPFESEIIQGDTGPMWQIGIPKLNLNGSNDGYDLLTNYSCTLKYTNLSGADVTRVVTGKNVAGDRFLAQLTSAESNVLSVGLNRIVIQLKDSGSPPYRSEVQIDLTVKSQRYVEP